MTTYRFTEKRPFKGQRIYLIRPSSPPIAGRVLTHDSTKFLDDLHNTFVIRPTDRWRAGDVIYQAKEDGGHTTIVEGAPTIGEGYDQGYETRDKPTDPFKATIKDNPKDVLGSKKLPFSALPWAVIAEAAAGMGEGAIKYGKHNYEAVGIRHSIYFDACLRHLIADFLGEEIDPDSGIPHITKAISTLLVLRDAQIYDKCTDDRPPAPPADHLAAVKELFASLIKDVTDCGKHYDRASIERRNNDDN